MQHASLLKQSLHVDCLPCFNLQTVTLLEAKIEMLRGNLTTARQELDEAAGLKHDLDKLRNQLTAAGIEPELASPAASQATSRSASQPEGIPISTHQQSASPGQVSPSQISPGQVSPFQTVAMQEPGLSWIQSPQQSVDNLQAENLQSGLLSAEPSALFSGSAVAQLQQLNAALKAELAQLSQREAAEEADVAGLQSQNRDLITEVEKLRTQVGEVCFMTLFKSCSKATA